MKKNKKVKVIYLYGYNDEKGCVKGDVMFLDGSVYEMCNFNPADFDVTGEENEQLLLAKEMIKNKEDEGLWEPNHVSAQVVEIEL